jgi:hypothetical protein
MAIIASFRQEAARCRNNGGLSYAFDVKIDLAVVLLQAANKAIDRQK